MLDTNGVNLSPDGWESQFRRFLDDNYDYSPSTLEAYMSSARRFMRDAGAKNRNTNDNRALVLLSAFFKDQEQRLVYALQEMCKENVAVAAIEHPDDLDIDQVLVNDHLSACLVMSRRASEALRHIPLEDRRTIIERGEGSQGSNS